MNVSEQLRRSTKQFARCFYCDKLLAVRIILFILFGLTPLWFYILECIQLWYIRMFQVIGDDAEAYIHNSKLPAAVRCMMIFVCLPLLYVTHVSLPMLNMPFWATHFVFNIFAFPVSLGKSGWTGIVTENELRKEREKNELNELEKGNDNSFNPDTELLEKTYVCGTTKLVIKGDAFVILKNGVDNINGNVRIVPDGIDLVVPSRGVMKLKYDGEDLKTTNGLVYKKVASK